MHSFYKDPARRPMVMSSGAVACLAAPEGREAERGAARGGAEGTREAEEAARASRTERRGAWHHLQWTIGSERAARR